MTQSIEIPVLSHDILKDTRSQSTGWFDRAGGRLAYTDVGNGPLVVCVPGLGDLRDEYRFLLPVLADAGFRAVSLDLRGHGESSIDWDDYSAEAIGGDILGLIHHLEAGPALLVGTSMAAGAAVWAATEEADAVTGLVLIAPFVRDVGSQIQQHLYRALFRIVLSRPWGVSFWMGYWKSLFPSQKPRDFDDYAQRLRANLEQPQRFAALRAMMLGPSRSRSKRDWRTSTHPRSCSWGRRIATSRILKPRGDWWQRVFTDTSTWSRGPVTTRTSSFRSRPRSRSSASRAPRLTRGGTAPRLALRSMRSRCGDRSGFDPGRGAYPRRARSR